jgi:hypothetical protein
MAYFKKGDYVRSTTGYCGEESMSVAIVSGVDQCFLNTFLIHFIGVEGAPSRRDDHELDMITEEEYLAAKAFLALSEIAGAGK